jgi:hypothetical protein
MASTYTPDFGEGARVDTRDAGDVKIVDVTGRLTIGPPNSPPATSRNFDLLPEIVRISM